MHDAPASVLTAWANYYVIMGSSAAALTGLMFVVVTLIANRSRVELDWSAGITTFSSPTVVHFCVALLIAAILSAPWQSLAPARAVLGVTGIFGICYVLRAERVSRRLKTYEPLIEDWISYIILPFLAYLAIAASAVVLSDVTQQALYALAGATLLLIFIGIHNAWDVVTYLAIDQLQQSDETDKTPPAAR